MSIEKTTNSDISERLNLLVNELAEGNAKLFAEKANISQATFHNYTKGRPPNSTSLNNICKSYKVSLNWLISGIGEKFIQNRSGDYPCDPDPEVAQLLEGARRVLRSGNPIAFEALKHNIKYFDHAVKVEEDQKKTKERLEEVEKNMESIMALLMNQQSDQQKQEIGRSIAAMRKKTEKEIQDKKKGKKRD